MPDNKAATTQPVAASPASGAATQENKSFLQKYGGQIAQMIFFWLVMKTITGGWNNNQNVPKPSTNAPNEASTNMPTTEYIPGSKTLRDYTAGIPDNVFYYPNPALPVQELPDTIVPLWHPGTPMDVSIFINENPYFVDYQANPDYYTTGLSYTNWFEPKLFQLEIPATKTMQHNGTVFAHIFVTQHKMSINPNSNGFNPDALVYYRHELTKFYPQKSQVKQKNLLKGGDEEDESEVEEHTEQTEKQAKEATAGGLGGLLRRAPLVAHWQQNFTLSIVADTKSAIPKNALQSPTIKYIPFDTHLSRVPSNDKVGYYRPIVFPNEFWSLQQNAYMVNETVSTLPLNIHIEPISMWKFNIYANLDESMKQQANSPLGGMTSSDLDEVKRMFLETNPILLATTIFVSCLHSVFEILAFKNDISFWKQKGNSTGISVRSLIVNIFFQIVIFLYLLDNNQETSYMVLLSNGFGLLLEFWKVFKALKYELVWTPGSLFPKLGQQDTEKDEEEDETAKYDAIAFKYLKWVSYPLLAGYAVYSLYYDEHKSWYSYVLKTLVEFVYMFGFITMLPQLYINYRLKSVAHMPWKTLMYKSLNTFIDDLFAFVIKMPTLHRLACLRDDFVFFVYLYQRYKYKTDHTRANEYGQVGAENTEEQDKKESKKNK